jgi:hypothetical protein
LLEGIALRLEALRRRTDEAHERAVRLEKRTQEVCACEHVCVCVCVCVYTCACVSHAYVRSRCSQTKAIKLSWGGPGCRGQQRS